MSKLTKIKPYSLESLFPDFFNQDISLFRPHVFESIFKNFYDFGMRGFGSFVDEPSNIYETEKEYVIEYTQSGIPQDKWDIEVKDDYILIKAENATEQEEKEDDKKYYKYTSNYVKINNKFKIPNNADIQNITASYKDGIIKIQMPKKEINETPVTKIEIKNE